MNTSEYLSPDFLEHNFVKCFRPIHTVQRLLGISRVDVRANFATHTTRLQKLYSLLNVVLAGVACRVIMKHYYEVYYTTNRTVFLTSAFGLSFYYFSLVCKMFHIRCVGGNDSIRLYVILQKIDRSLNLTYNELAFRRQNYLNWATIAVTFFGLPGNLVETILEMKGDLITICMAYAHIVSIMEILFIGCLIHYVIVRLVFLNEAIKELTSVNVESVPLVNPLFTADISVKKHGLNPEEIIKKLVTTLMLILQAFKVINKIYNFQMLVFTASLFVWPLLVIESLVMGLGTKVMVWLACLVISLWTLFFYLQLIYLSWICDRFEKHIQHTKRLCIEVLFKCNEGSLLKSAKEMLTIIEWEAPQFRVYGIFTLDRNLPLNLVSLVTGYIIILVQFTLL